MHRAIRRVTGASAQWSVAMLLSLLVLGCPDRNPDVADGDADGGRDVDTSDVNSETDVDASSPCEDPPTCGEGERLVGCDRCVDTLNRVCESDRDCRPRESCEEAGRLRVCMYEPKPMRTCPGSEGCREGATGPLEVGAASRTITPTGFERPKPAGVDGDNYMNFRGDSAPDDKWRDCGIDGLCPGDDGYDGPDRGEDDDQLQGMWLAGFSPGRPAQYCPTERVGCSDPECCTSRQAHDPLKVQIAVMRRGATTVALATVDTIGWFHTDQARIRRRIPEELGIDLFVMAALHNHEAPDTAGQWGPGQGLPQKSGRSPRFIRRIYRETVDGLREAVGDLRQADAEAAIVDRGISGLAMSDSRPPYIFDDNIPVVRFVDSGTGDPIATLLSLGNHPEVLWSDNPYITADYPHYVRKYVREGLDAVPDGSGGVRRPELPGFGGVTLMFAGAVGGLINPGDGGAVDYAGDRPSEPHSFEAADAVGQRVASRVLGAHEAGEFTELSDPNLAFGHQEFLVPIRNRRFQLAAYQFGLLERATYNAARPDPSEFIPGPPKVLSEVNIVRLGELTFFTAPGEVFPETLTGGYPGKPTVQDPTVGDVRETEVAATCGSEGLPTSDGSGSEPCLVSPDQTNPPDWSDAPGPPYVYERVPGKYPFFIGLGGDFVGYMVPRFDYDYPNYQSEAPGSHYEETQSLGAEVLGEWKSNLSRVIGAVSE